MESNTTPIFFALDYNTSGLNLKTPLDSGGKWINYGVKNTFPQEIIELYNSSPTHSGIINKKAYFVSGKGLDTTNNTPEFVKFINECNLGKGLFNLIRRLSLDLVLYNGFTTQVLFHKYQRKIKDIIYQDFSQVRRGFRTELNEYKTHDQCVYISQEWLDRYKFTPEPYNYYDKNVLTSDLLEIPSEPVFQYIWNESVGKDWYALPTYFAAFKSIQSEISLINFKFNNIENSFAPSCIIDLPGTLTDDELKRFKEEAKKELTGTNNTGKMFFVMSDGEKRVVVTPMSSSPEDRKINDYVSLTTQEIISGHSLPSPTIIGLPGGVSLSGDANTLQVSNQLFFDQMLELRTQIINELNQLIIGAGFNNDKIVLTESIPEFKVESKF